MRRKYGGISPYFAARAPRKHIRPASARSVVQCSGKRRYFACQSDRLRLRPLRNRGFVFAVGLRRHADAFQNRHNPGVVCRLKHDAPVAAIGCMPQRRQPDGNVGAETFFARVWRKNGAGDRADYGVRIVPNFDRRFGACRRRRTKRPKTQKKQKIKRSRRHQKPLLKANAPKMPSYRQEFGGGFHAPQPKPVRRGLRFNTSFAQTNSCNGCRSGC